MENTNASQEIPAEPSFQLATEDGRPRGGRANEIRLALQEEIESGKLELAAVEMRIGDVFSRVLAMLQEEARRASTLTTGAASQETGT